MLSPDPQKMSVKDAGPEDQTRVVPRGEIQGLDCPKARNRGKKQRFSSSRYVADL
jgi:hypothetical protein